MSPIFVLIQSCHTKTRFHQLILREVYISMYFSSHYNYNVFMENVAIFVPERTKLKKKKKKLVRAFLHLYPWKSW